MARDSLTQDGHLGEGWRPWPGSGADREDRRVVGVTKGLHRTSEDRGADFVAWSAKADGRAAGQILQSVVTVANLALDACGRRAG